MKSLNYTLFHSGPKNLDDCIDYALRPPYPEAGAKVSLDLRLDIEVLEGYIFNRVTGRYSWVFPDGVRADFERVFGRYLEGGGSHLRSRSVNAADNRIKSDLGRITRSGIQVDVHRGSPEPDAAVS